jgi:hypothetical protein
MNNRYSHQTEFKVKFRQDNQEETKKRYIRKNLTRDH